MPDFFHEHPLLLVVARTAGVYCFILLGMRIVGRRTFRGLGPHELILLTLLAKIVSDNIIPKETGMTGNLVAGLTLFGLVWLVNLSPSVRHAIEPEPVTLCEEGMINEAMLKRHMLSERDLERVARDYGRRDWKDFECIVLEKDGHLTGILKEGLEKA